MRRIAASMNPALQYVDAVAPGKVPPGPILLPTQGALTARLCIGEAPLTVEAYIEWRHCMRLCASAWSSPVGSGRCGIWVSQHNFGVSFTWARQGQAVQVSVSLVCDC